MVRRGVGLAYGIFLATGLNLVATTPAPAQALAEPAVAADSVVRMVAEAKALPVASPEKIPLHGTFWLVMGEGSFLLPMPYLPYDLAGVPVFSLSSPGQFLVDATGGVAPQPTPRQAARGVNAATLLQLQADAVLDLIAQVQIAYAAEQAATARKMARAGRMSQADAGPPMPGDGGGDTNDFEILPEGGSSLSGFGSNDLWLQIFMTNRTLARLLINAPDTNGIYDVYATSNLNQLVPGLNLTNWTQLTRTLFGQTNVVVTNLWPDLGFFRLGTLLDSDSDGLPDAFEILVSHTNPNGRDTDGDGMLDGDELNPGGLPWRLEQVRRSAAVVYASAPVAAEGGACGLFTVYLPSPAPAGGMTVQYRLGGTAVLNTDYTLSPAAGSLPIFAGQSSASILVCASNNTTYSDLDRHVEITLTNATVGVVDSAPARVDIVDNDPPAIRLFALPNWVREPSATYGTNPAAFYFVRDGDATNAVTLNFTLSGSAVAGVNFTALPASVTFPANVRTNLLTVITKADTNTTTDKTLTLTLATATGYQMDPTANAATITIANVSTPQTAGVQVTATDDDAREAGLNPGVFTFTRTGVTADALRIYYHTTGTAKSGSTNIVRDYFELPGYVDFLPGAVSTNVTVTPVDKALAQVMRTVIVVLAGGDYAIGTNHQATVYLDDNDGTSYSPVVVREGVYGTQFRQPAILQVTRSGSALSTAKLHYVLAYGFIGNTNTSQGASGDVAGADIIWTNRQSVATVKFDPNWQNFPTTTLNPQLTLSNAVLQTSFTLPFHLPKDLISVNSSAAPATTVVEGNTVSGALVFRRPYPDANAQTLTYTTTGSAGSGTDYTVGSTVIGGSASQLPVNVQALNNAASAQWRTAVIGVASTTSQVPQEGLDHAFIRIQDSVVTDPLQDSDLDGDGLSDGVELSHAAQGYDPLEWDNAYADDDRDGVSVFEEFLLGTDPTVADAPPVYPSPEDSDYMPLRMRIGAAGKVPDSLNVNCAVCHNVTLRAGPFSRTCPRSSQERGPAEVYELIRFLRGTNYALHVSANPYQAILPSSQTNTTPAYTAKYTAQVWHGTNGVYPFITDTNQLLGVNLPLIREVYPKTATLYVPDMLIAADVDRDGLVTFSNRTDRTYATNPFTFWINDDVDLGNTDEAADSDPSANTLDSVTPGIISLRDLEDFTRLQFKLEGLPSQFVNNPNLLTKIYLTNLSGVPSLRLFPVTGGAGGIGYLTNYTTASLQVLQTAIGVVSSSTPLSLPNGSWLNAGSNAYFIPLLFEGISTGRCVITFGIASNTGPALALSRPFYLDLKPVTSLYEHWTVGDNTNTDWRYIPAQPTRTADSAVFYDPKTTGGLDYVLFVHGWRMPPWERRAFASTGFKRLWHLGYQGRYGLFSWPTDNTGTSFWDMTSLANRQNYDRSEQRAWNSAKGLEYLLRELNKEQTYRVRLLAHSMGNIVTSEALRLYAGETNMPLIHTYIASQAASVAHAYDAVNPAQARSSDRPEVYAHFQRGNTNQPYFTGMKNAVSKYPGSSTNRIVNFNNFQDYALNSTLAWPFNQFTKPDLGWYYLNNPASNIWTYWNHGSQLYMDAKRLDHVFEIYAYMAMSWSKALGCAEDNNHHVQGEIGGAVDLNIPPFNFKANDYEHSAEFNSINMNRRSYWWQVLSTFSLTNNLPNP